MDEDQKLKHCDRCATAFDSVFTSMITFFQLLVMGEGIDYFMVPMMEYHWSAAVFLLIATAVVYLGISNLILSVIVDKANEARCQDGVYQAMTNKKLRAHAKKELEAMWKDADVDMDGSLTLEELRTAFEYDDKFRAYFREMDIELSCLEAAHSASNDDFGECTYQALADEVVRMKNTDMGSTIALVKLQMRQVLDGMEFMSKQMGALKKDLKKGTEATTNQLRRSQSAMANSVKQQSLLPFTQATGEHSADNGGGILSSVMTEMLACFNSDSSPPEPPQMLRNSGTVVSLSMKGSSPEVSNNLGVWHDDGDCDDDDDYLGRRARTKKDAERDMLAAAASAKELAGLQSQAQEIERNLRNLKSKLSVGNRDELDEDAKILLEILADIRRQEEKLKSEISDTMLGKGKAPRSGSRKSTTSSSKAYFQG